MTKTIFFHVGHLQNKDISKFQFASNSVKPILEALEDSKEVHFSVPQKLKSRAAFYKFLSKDKNIKIHTVFYPQSFQDFLTSFSGSIEYAQKEFSKLQASIVGTDTDEISLAKGYEVDLKESVIQYIKENIDVDNHDTPHHKETISQHISMTIENSEKVTDLPSNLKDILEVTSAFHDLGKYWTKSFDKTVGYSRYFGHENVSSVIFLSHILKNSKVITEQTPSITKIILLHMAIKNGPVSQKVKRRLKLSDEEILLLNIFNEIDTKSRVSE